MELQFLGTGAGAPAKHRNVSSLVLKLLDEINQVWMFDCGESTQHQILHTTIRPRKVTKIFITHLHGDHIFGLPGFLASRNFQADGDPITIYGPKGIKEFVLFSLKMAQTKLQYRINFEEISGQVGRLFSEDGFTVNYYQLDHGIETYAYRIEEKDQVGTLLIDKVKEAGVPNGPLLGKLKAGQEIQLADGRVLNGKDFLGPEKPGRIVTIFGDTRYHKEFSDFAKGSTCLVYEATFAKEDTAMAWNYHHSSTIQAAELAKNAEAGLLLMNHISARYVGKAEKLLQAEAQAIFKEAYIAHDLESFVIDYVDVNPE